MSDLYNRIHGLCEELQISDAEACKAVQMPRSTLSNLKNGHAKKLGAEKLNSFSLFFSRELGRKITVEYLFGEPGEDSGDDLAPDDLYNRIHSLVLDKGMTDGSACAAVGLPRSTLGSLKTGKTKSLSQKNLKLFAELFKVSVDSLLNEENSVDDLAASVPLALYDGAEDEELPDDIKNMAAAFALAMRQQKKPEQPMPPELKEAREILDKLDSDKLNAALLMLRGLLNK